MEFIIIYLVIGVILNIVGPLAKVIRREVEMLDFSSTSHINGKEKPIPKWKAILFEVTLRCLNLFFYPFLFLLWVIDFYREKKSLKGESEEIINSLGRYSGGVDIKCNDCGWENTVISSIHGFDPNSKKEWYEFGYQCQECGKFIGIKNRTLNEDTDKCECGGYLSSDKPLFCPKCKSINITAKTVFLT